MKFILKKLTFLLLCFTLFSQTPLAAAHKKNDTNAEACRYTLASSVCVIGAFGTGFLHYVSQCMGPFKSSNDISPLIPALCSAAGLIGACAGYTQADAATETGRSLKNINIVFGGISLVTGVIAVRAF